MTDEVLIKVDGVSKKFCRSLRKSLIYGLTDVARDLNPLDRARSGRAASLRAEEFWAVKDVSFELKRGECLGLIGRNGAGKTTLLKMLNGLIKPDAGRIEMRGRVGALIALGAGFNPILSGRENICVNGSVLGLTQREVSDKMDEIIDFADIRDFIDTPVQSYSSGMQVRLGFAVATAMNPDVLILDEVLAVGDAAFRAKCFQRIGHIMHKACVIFVSHDPVQVSRICDYCLYLKKGEAVAWGETETILSRYHKDSPSVLGEASIVLDAGVTHFYYPSGDIELNWGETLKVHLSLKISGGKSTGLALMALMDGELPVAQADVTDQINNNLNVDTKDAIQLGPLHLREGDYGLTITILDESRKVTLVHALNCVSVRISGPVGYGVPYQIPAFPCIK